MGLNNITATQTVVVATAITTVTFLGTFLYKKWRSVKLPSKWEKVGTVKKLRIYPLKSGNKVELQKAEITEVGLKQTEEDQKAYQLRDRVLVVYGAKDLEFRTARTYPKMIFIDVSVHDENHLAIDGPNMRTLYVKIPKRGDDKTVNIKFHSNEKIEALDCGEEAASWFSRYIIERDTGLRLGYNDQYKRRDITKAHQKLLNYYTTLGNQSTGLYQDLTSVSLISQSSVDDLNEKIGSSEVTVDNFRHNVIVDGTEPYDEDNWEWIKIGDNVVMRNVKECTRCVFTTINPENGVRHAKREPLRTLGGYRRSAGPEKEPIIGINIEVRKTGFIHVGEAVYVARKETAK